MTDYPRFHSIPVSLSPGSMKSFTPADMKALCEAFKQLTDADPLGPGLVARQWKTYQENRFKDAFAKAMERWASLTPEQKDAEMLAQRESWVRAEQAFGTDEDEFEYRRRLREGEAK